MILVTLCMLVVTAVYAAPDHSLPQTPQNVLFVGNSYTFTNLSLNITVLNVALSAVEPETFSSDASLIGGATLKQHWNTLNAAAKIRTGDFDVVVLQEFLQMKSGTAEMDTFFHYAGLFDALIDSVGAQTVFYQTWQTTWLEFDNLENGYDSAGITFNAPVVPAGEGWGIVNNDRTSINLYAVDKHHPGWPGTYLTSCIFYAALTGKSPIGNTYKPVPTISDEDYAYLQGAAWDVMRNYIDPACANTSAPTVPTGVAGTAVSTSSIRVSWTASTHAACGVRKYKIFRDGTFVGASYQPVFTDAGLLGGTAYQYTISALGLGGGESSVSASASATTLQDVTPPELLEARYTRIPTKVNLFFSEQLDQASAETAGNYSVNNGISVVSASLDNDMVTLTTSAMSADIVYTVTASGIKDNATSKNTMLASAQKSFSYIPLSMMTNSIGYWPFDKTLDDFSAYGQKGDWYKGESYTTGHDKDCIVMSGDSTSPYVVIPANVIQGGMDQFTFALWIKKNNASNGGPVLLKYGVMQLNMTDNDITGTISTANGNCQFDKATSLITDTEWHHIAVTYDGAAVRLYLDASEINSVPYTGVVQNTTTRPIYVGKNPWNSKPTFDGNIDEFRMYDDALNATEVAALFNDEPYAEGDADSAAVRILLDRNGVAQTVDAVTLRNRATGRVLGLYLNSLAVDQITDHIGQLTMMRTLQCVGNPTTDTSLISIDPAIGNCTALETLIINDNTLTSLPDAITNLTNLTYLDVGNNKLCSISASVQTWLDTYDPDWASSQTGCSSGILQPLSPVSQTSAFTVRQIDGRVHIIHNGTGKARVRIINTDGTAAFSRSFSGNTATWHPASTGIYILEMTTRGNIETMKMLIRTK